MIKPIQSNVYFKANEPISANPASTTISARDGYNAAIQGVAQIKQQTVQKAEGSPSLDVKA